MQLAGPSGEPTLVSIRRPLPRHVAVLRIAAAALRTGNRVSFTIRVQFACTDSRILDTMQFAAKLHVAKKRRTSYFMRVGIFGLLTTLDSLDTEPPTIRYGSPAPVLNRPTRFRSARALSLCHYRG